MRTHQQAGSTMLLLTVGNNAVIEPACSRQARIFAGAADFRGFKLVQPDSLAFDGDRWQKNVMNH